MTGTLLFIAQETATSIAESAALLFEAAGILVILVGSVGAVAIFANHAVRRRPLIECFEALRRNLGHAILLGLEFLIAADIIGTVLIEPTFTNVGVLGLLVVVRTFLSIALTVEIEGHWPWQGQPHAHRRPDTTEAR